jgi:hypothetical protein
MHFLVQSRAWAQKSSAALKKKNSIITFMMRMERLPSCACFHVRTSHAIFWGTGQFILQKWKVPQLIVPDLSDCDVGSAQQKHHLYIVKMHSTNCALFAASKYAKNQASDVVLSGSVFVPHFVVIIRGESMALL